jgi:hypothetical protein
VFDLSASASLMAPFVPISLAVLSERSKKATSLLQWRLSEVRHGIELSASDNLIIPSSPILLPVSSENELGQQILYCGERVLLEMSLI